MCRRRIGPIRFPDQRSVDSPPALALGCRSVPVASNSADQGSAEGIRVRRESGEVVSIVEWKCTKIPQGSQLAVLFKFTGDKVHEERWFIDTEQWKAAF